MIWLGGPQPEALRNGVDAWLRSFLDSTGLPCVYAVPFLLAGLFFLWSVYRWDDRPGDAGGVYVGMLIESTLFAFLLWFLSRRLGPLFETLQVEGNHGPPRRVLGQVVTFVGAGVYEEVVFRLLLCLMLRFALFLLAIPGIIAWPLVLIGSSLLFAAAHHFGPSGEPFTFLAFTFRALAGLYFCLLYQVRGFAIAVGAHAGYDVLVGVLMP